MPAIVKGMYYDKKGCLRKGKPPKAKGKSKAKPKDTAAVKQVKKQVTELAKKVDAANSTLVRKIRNTDRVITVGDNTCQVDTPFQFSLSTLQNAMSSIRYYDSATDALVTYDLTSGTYSQELLVKAIYSKLTVRNNYDVPCQVTAYLVTPKVDTSIQPQTAYTNGVTDQVTNGTSTDPIIYPTDIDQFNAIWKIERSKSMFLQAGQQFTLNHAVKTFKFNPSVYDSHALVFQKKFGSYCWMLRVEGALAHDNTNGAQQGTIQAAVDVMQDTKVTIIYDSGKDLNDIYLATNAIPMTTQALVGNKPVANNQPFSVP